MCTSPRCIPADESLSAQLTATADVVAVGGQVYLERLELNTASFTLATNGFVIHTEPDKLTAHAPNGEVHVLHRTAPATYEGDILLTSQNAGQWRFVASFWIEFADGHSCNPKVAFLLGISNVIHSKFQVLKAGASTKWKFAVGNDGNTAANLEDIELLIDGTSLAVLPTATTPFFGEYYTAIIDNSLAAVDDYELTVGTTVFNFTVDFTNVNLVASTINDLIRNQYDADKVGTHTYLDSLIKADKDSFVPSQINAASHLPIVGLKNNGVELVTGTAIVQTGMSGTFVNGTANMITLGLGLSTVQLAYDLAGAIKTQTFTYNPLTDEYDE